MAFTKKGSIENPSGSPVMAGPGVSKMNPSSPGFPQQVPSTRTGVSVDHGTEISAAQSRHQAGRNPSQKGMKSADHHLSNERRSRPDSMELGKQILDGQKGKQPSGTGSGKNRADPNAKLSFPKSGGKGNPSMPAPNLGKLMPRM